MFILTHLVNVLVERKPERPEKPHDSRPLGSSNIENVLTENRTRNLRGEKQALWPQSNTDSLKDFSTEEFNG